MMELAAIGESDEVGAEVDAHVGLYHAEDSTKSPNRSGLPLNMDALSGLRGLLMLHVIVFHSFYFSTANRSCDEIDTVWNDGLDLMGSASMTPFFLLTGFSLAVVYGTRPMDGSFDKVAFWRNRFARTMPAYWLVNLLAVPAAYLGYGNVIFGATSSSTAGSIFYSIVPIWTWVAGAWSNAMWFAGPAWTVQTMWFFYATFPWCMRLVQARKLPYQTGYWVCFLVQLVLGTTFTALISYHIDSFQIGTFVGLASPYTRLPLFFMGLLAGQELVEKKDQGLPHFGSKICLPFCCCFANYCCKDHAIGLKAASDETGASPAPLKEDVEVWARQVDTCSAGLVFFYLLIIVVHNTATTKEQLYLGDCMSAAFQMLNCWPYLMLCVGLTRDNNTSCTGRFLAGPAMQALGTISMGAYLVHMVFMYYVAYLFNGNIDPSKSFNTRTASCELLPAWGVVIILPLGLLGGWLMTEYFEGPCRNFLRVKRPGAKPLPHQRVELEAPASVESAGRN